MRCYSCDRNLTDYETSIKSKATGQYLDLCCKCLDGLNIQYTANKDLTKTQQEAMDELTDSWIREYENYDPDWESLNEDDE